MFAIDTTALWVVLLFLFAFALLYRYRKKGTPVIFFSTLSPLKGRKKSLRATFSPLPHLLNCLALALLLVAFIDPHFQTKERLLPPTTEGIAIYFVLDQSGSMKEQVKGVRQRINKLDLLKGVTRSFIQERPNDLIGVISFARSANVLAPLTLDHREVVKQLNALTFVPSKEQEGTAIGYAIYKTVSLINAMRAFQDDSAYAIKNSIIILVTDGFQDVNPLDRDKKLRSIDLSDASEFAAKSHVKLYVINVDPLLATEKFTPHRHLLKRITEKTGGAFYITGGTQTLKDVYEQINKLETSPIPEEKFPPLRIKSLYPLFLALALLSLGLAHLLNTTVMRSIP